MIELTIIVSLIVFTLIGMRTRPRPLENPVIIQRHGDYHMTLAPKLNLITGFIERIAKHYRSLPAVEGDSEILCFEVRDPSLKRHGIETYLLAVTLRNNLLYFQALLPQPAAKDDNTPYKQIHDYALAVLVNMPFGTLNAGNEQRISESIQQGTQGSEISVTRMIA